MALSPSTSVYVATVSGLSPATSSGTLSGLLISTKTPPNGAQTTATGVVQSVSTLNPVTVGKPVSSLVLRQVTLPDGGEATTTSLKGVSATSGLLALTTIFTSPSSCSTRPFTLTSASEQTHGVWDLDDEYTGLCYPPNWAIAKSQYYTPGVCPSGYGIANIGFYGTTTAMACCPGDMSFINGMCQTLINTSKEALCFTTYFAVSSFTMSDGSTTSSVWKAASWTTSTITNFPFTGVATPVSVAWVSSNLASFTPASAPALAIAHIASFSTSTTPLPTAPSSALPTAGTSSTSTSLTTGAKAGIAVGVVLGLVLLLGAAIMFWRRRKQRQQRLRAMGDAGQDRKAELSGETAYREPPPEMDAANNISEMQGQHSMPELDHESVKVELEVPGRVHELP